MNVYVYIEVIFRLSLDENKEEPSRQHTRKRTFHIEEEMNFPYLWNTGDPSCDWSGLNNMQ